MTDLMKKLVEADFEDQFKPASDEELEKRGVVDHRGEATIWIAFSYKGPSGDDVEAFNARMESMADAVGKIIGGISNVSGVIDIDVTDTQAS